MGKGILSGRFSQERNILITSERSLHCSYYGCLRQRQFVLWEVVLREVRLGMLGVHGMVWVGTSVHGNPSHGDQLARECTTSIRWELL